MHPLLTMETTEGSDPITEHRLRAVVAMVFWREQRRVWLLLTREMASRTSR
jgi:hypothetical protein